MEGGSVALDALFSIAQTTVDALEDDLQHDNDNIIQHPTLVDPNDLAMATVLIVEEELDYGDLRWSLLSNTFFIFGGFYECINAIWDLKTNDGQQEEDISTNKKLRIGISLLGPLVYCFNSIVDITWALRVEQRQDRRQQLDELEIDLIAPDEDVEVVEDEYGSFIYYIWPLISASLWLFDALCYLRADVNSMKSYKKSRLLAPASKENDSSTCSGSCDFQEQQ